jgi:hypothetical protein
MAADILKDYDAFIFKRQAVKEEERRYFYYKHVREI